MDKMTGANFYAYILRIFKRTDKSTEVYEAITDAIMDIKLGYYFEDYKETAYEEFSAVADYKMALPDDFGHIIGDVRLYSSDGTEKVLTKLSKETFDSLYPYPDSADVSTGVPKHYCIYGGQIYVGCPVGSTDYTIEMNYSTEEGTEITSSTTEVPFTNRYRETIRAAALYRLYEGLGYDEEAMKWKLKAQEGVNKMIVNDEFNTEATEIVDYQGV